MTFEYVVTNIGNLPLSDISVFDDMLGLICEFSTLDVGDTETCSATAELGNTGQQSNVGTVTAKYGSTEVTDSDLAYYDVEPTGSISGAAFEDLNGNGQRDAGEPGKPGVIVDLYDCIGNWIASTTTDVDGSYLFINLTPGDYRLVFNPVAGSVFTPQDQGADDALDSDADPATGVTACTTLSPGENDDTWDAGMYFSASIGDLVWEDDNRNGIQEAGEPGIPGVTVELEDSVGNLIATTTTDANGVYQFFGLTPGDYRIVFVAPAPYFFSPQDQGADDTKDSDANPSTGETDLKILSSGEVNNTVDAGMYFVS